MVRFMKLLQGKFIFLCGLRFNKKYGTDKKELKKYIFSNIFLLYWNMADLEGKGFLSILMVTQDTKKSVDVCLAPLTGDSYLS